MANIINKPNGRKAVQYVGTDGRRRTISIGNRAMQTYEAEAVAAHVETLRQSKLNGRPVVRATEEWVATLPHEMLTQLADGGLVPKPESTGLAAFIDGYIGERTDVKDATTTVYGHTRRCLVEHFGADRGLASITSGDADRWRTWLTTKGLNAATKRKLVKKPVVGLSENTVRRRCGIARQLFRAAVRRKLIQSNPFDGLPVVVRGNRKRDYFVSRAETTAILNQCPDAEWKLIVALARYGGLRCPSEIMALKLEDVNWETGRFTVNASKTEHHEDGGVRIVPVFPELLPHLREVFEAAEPGATHFITRYALTVSNLRTHFARIIKRAGLVPWPKLFQNLRATRETELRETFPGHVVCDWIGHNEDTATEHYLQVTDDHFRRATTASAANALQHPPASGRTAAMMSAPNRTDTHKNAGGVRKMGPLGLEPRTRRL